MTQKAPKSNRKAAAITYHSNRPPPTITAHPKARRYHYSTTRERNEMQNAFDKCGDTAKIKKCPALYLNEYEDIEEKTGGDPISMFNAAFNLGVLKERERTNSMNAQKGDATK